MLTETTSTVKLEGVDPVRQGVYLGNTFSATQDGGKTRFPKHFVQLVLFKNSGLFHKLIKEIKVGDQLRVTIVADGLDQPYLTDYQAVRG